MFAHYVAVALRNVRGAPLTSVLNVVTLAVGLVCFVTAYAFVTFWGSAERHFANARDIYVLTLTIRNRDTGSGLENYPRVPDVVLESLKSDYPAIAKVARATLIDGKTMIASAGHAERVFGSAADPEFLELFDLPFVAGDARTALASPRSVVITRDLAARLFGADNPIGKSIVIGNSVDATVTGVIGPIAEPSHLGRSANAALPFDLLASIDVRDALRPAPPPGVPFGGGWFSLGNTIVYVYLPASGGLTPAALAAQLEGFAARHVPAEMLRTNDYRIGIVPVGKVLSGTGDFFDTGLSFATVLLLLGGLVLGVACVNYANLATARAARRVREIGVRKALGASPAQIAVQSLFEAGALALAALVVALALFALAQPLVKRLLGAELGATFFSTLAVWPALGLLVAAVTAAAGAYPALVLARVRPVTAIASSRARLGSPLFSTLLVGTQFGVASFLLIAVTVTSLQNADMRRTALSAIEDPLVIIENATRQTRVTAGTLRERLGTLPQVRGVTEVAQMPWQSLFIQTIRSSPDPTGPQHTATVRDVGFDFFDLFRVPTVAGRVFDREHAEDVPPPSSAPGSTASAGSQAPSDSPSATNIVVDRSLIAALELGTPEQALDKLVYQSLPPAAAGAASPPPWRIVGVVEDRAFSFYKIKGIQAPAGTIYRLIRDSDLTVARVSAADLDTGLDRIDAAWKELAPNVAISRRFLDEVFERSYSQYVRINQLLGALAVMAFGICVAGLFGMAAFVAGRRRREVGVRKTLGARTPQMVALLLVGFSRPVLVANLVAWPAGYVAVRVYLNQFSHSIALTPWPFVLSVAITLAIACLAVVGQTLRAARTTPAEVLRHE